MGLSVLLIVGVGLLYAPVLGFDFVRYDDHGYVFENAVVLRGLTLDGVGWAFTTTELSNWHPLTWLSHMVDVQLFGEWAGGHHATSVVLHALNSALVFLLLRDLTSRSPESVCVAALFAAHPLHVESVAWISDRKDLLAAFFGLLAMIAYTHYARTGSVRAYAATVVAYGGCLLSKQMLVTLPFLLLLLDGWPLGRVPSRGRALLRELRPLVVEKLPLFILAAVATGVIYAAQSAGGAVGDIPLLQRVANALVSIPRYLSHVAWPLGLAPLYPLPAASGPGWSGGAAAAAALFVAGASAGAVYAWTRRRVEYVTMGWFWFLGGLVPVLGLVQVGQQAMADRYTYIPMLGIYVAIVWGAADVIRVRGLPRAVPIALMCGALAACAGVSRHQLGFWRDGETLFRRAIDVTERNWTMHFTLASQLEHEGRSAEALSHYQEAARLQTTDPLPTLTLADAYARLGRLHQAVRSWRSARRIAAGSSPRAVAEVANNLAWALATRPESTRADADAAVELALFAATHLSDSPARAQVRDTLAAAYAAAGDFHRAVQTARVALADARALDQPALAAELEQRLSRYARGRSARAP